MATLQVYYLMPIFCLMNALVVRLDCSTLVFNLSACFGVSLSSTLTVPLSASGLYGLPIVPVFILVNV